MATYVRKHALYATCPTSSSRDVRTCLHMYDGSKQKNFSVLYRLVYIVRMYALYLYALSVSCVAVAGSVQRAVEYADARNVFERDSREQNYNKHSSYRLALEKHAETRKSIYECFVSMNTLFLIATTNSLCRDTRPYPYSIVSLA